MNNRLLHQLNTLVRVQESKLLNREELDRLSSSASLEDAIGLLADLGYGMYFSEEDPLDFGGALKRAKSGLLEWAYEATEEQVLIDLFSLYEVVHDIKVLIKSHFCNLDLSFLWLENARYSQQELLTLVKLQKSSTMPKEMKEAVANCIEDYNRHQSLQRVELLLDRFYILYLQKLGKEIENVDLDKFLIAYIDLFYLSRFLQVHGKAYPYTELLFSDGGSISAEQWISLLEMSDDGLEQFFLRSPYRSIWKAMQVENSMRLLDVYVDNYLLGLCSEAKLTAFGVTPVLGYLYAKILELKNIRVILSGIVNNVSRIEVKKRMRDQYAI